MKLTFSKANTKLVHIAENLGLPKSHVVSFDLPAGWSCPKADKCLQRFNPKTRKMESGDNMEFACYAAKAERQYPNTAKMRWANFNALRKLSFDGMVELIEKSLPNRVEVVRIHSSGDFFSRDYFLAWVKVAENNPHIQFFAYTKVLEYVSYELPKNFGITYSHGSKDDNLWNESIPTCYVQIEDGQYPNIPLVCGTPETDHMDFLSIMQGTSFKLNLH